MNDKTYFAVEDLEVYVLLCDLHIQVCDLSSLWPREELYELGSQIRRSSNSSPSQLAEKNDDRHIRNKIEGVNRARGEAGETIHHLFMAFKKRYIDRETFEDIRASYKQCIRMLNGLERSLEKYVPMSDRRWPSTKEDRPDYLMPVLNAGYPAPEPACDLLSSPNTEHRTLTPYAL
jgi:four helix bundle protein